VTFLEQGDSLIGHFNTLENLVGYYKIDFFFFFFKLKIPFNKLKRDQIGLMSRVTKNP
jgi:hypothetical protein